ncbi:MAG: GDP-mannose 4,6-dehydratase [Sedimentisphaerales bacterium]|nr:GDP-mannose 4,6-dehydratase [Sedimentisphaerales bacterium]
MKALVTGGAGFIGSHLAQRLVGDGNEVIVVDNLSTGSLRNIEHIRNRPGFEFVEGDIRNAGLMESLAGRCEAIFHLAAAVGVQLIADSPVHTIETNIAGTQVVLEAANKFKCKILLASSSEVYGKNEAVPFHEEDDIILGSPSLSRWSYACSKAIDEFLGFAFHQQYGLGVVVARLFNTIGPRQTGRYGMVVPRFVQAALQNEPVRIYGTGSQTRCFCYVEDVVDAIIRLMECEQAAGKAFNVGSDEEITIEALADKIIAMTGSKSRKEFVPYEVAYGRPIEDMMRRVPRLERIRQTIGWEPKTGLAETLRNVIDSFKNR